MSFRLTVALETSRHRAVGAAYGPDRNVGKHVNMTTVASQHVHFVTTTVGDRA